MMTVTGYVHNGLIVPDQPLALGEGVKVRIEIMPSEQPTIVDAAAATPATQGRFADIIGIATGLPRKASEQVDALLDESAQPPR